MKKFSTFVLFLCVSMCLSAAPRTVDAAKALAATHFSSRSSAVSGKQNAPAAEPRLAYTHPLSAAEANTPALYVFNNGDNGFVIVSADDCTKEVLAYSDQGTFNASDIPANVQFYLNMYAGEIARAKAHGVVRKPAKKAAAYPAVSPLCTAQWDQDAPYNNLCPKDGSSRSVTGCVATAAAQLMYANKYPTKGTGSHSYTWNGKTLSVNFGSTTYQWSNMRDDYSGSSTSAQKSAVATLMYHCGVACDMDYSSDASGAYNEDMARGLISYFGYDKGIYYLPKDYLKENALLALMSNDLQAGHTIFMGGATKQNEGHAFICDGMDTKGYLHINWGWSGYCDGYYQISALEPADQGIGGASSGLPFTEDVTVALNIKPDAGGNEAVTLTATSITMTTATTIAKTDNATFNMAELENRGLYTVSADIAFSVYNEDWSYYGTGISGASVNLDPWYYYDNKTASVNLSSLADGKYYLSIGVVQNNTFWPILAYATGEQFFPFTVSGSTITFSEYEPEPEPEPIAPSLDFEYLTVYDYQSKGYDNNLDFYFETADCDGSGEVQVGTYIYLEAFARSMNSVVGTFVLDGTDAIGSIYAGELAYGDGTTEDCKELISGYLTVIQDILGNYLISFDFYDEDGNNYTLTEHTISSANMVAGTYDSAAKTWWKYTLSNDRVTAALPVSTTLNMIANIEGTSKTLHNFFVEGLISTIKNTPAQMETYGSCRLYLSDDGTTNKQLYGYNLRWLNNTIFTADAGEMLHEQDTIVVFGPLQNYNGNTPEVQGYIYEHHAGEKQPSAGVEQTVETDTPQKVLRDGQLYIRREKTIYDVLGKNINK